MTFKFNITEPKGIMQITISETAPTKIQQKYSDQVKSNKINN